ncbi:MAG: nucleotidyltransferase family protein [Chloroflexi bacterium]|nr:nucleotidyltransferase family protein [Chloroflexota bacterium]
MTRDEVLAVLSAHRDEIQRLGVRSLALFGSVARNEAGPDSDVDLLVEFDNRPVGLFHYARVQRYLETLLGVPKVDLVLRRAVLEELREEIYGAAVNVL